MKKVLIIGNNIKINSLESSYARALIALGFCVENISLEEINSPFVTKLNVLKSKVNSSSFITDEKLIINTIKEKNIDCVIIFKCWHLPISVIQKIKDLSYLINYTSDHPLANASLRRSIIRERVMLFDLIITFSENLVPVWYQLGANDVLVIGFGIDKMFRINPKTRHSFNFTYFGTWGAYIESHIEQLKIQDLTIFGPGWEKASKRFRTNHDINPVDNVNMYQLANNSKVVINFTRMEHGCFHTMKTFEIPNSGSFYVSNYSIEQDSFFNDGSEALYYKSYHDFSRIIKCINQGEIDLAAMRNAAFMKSNAFSYENLIVKLCERIKGI